MIYIGSLMLDDFKVSMKRKFEMTKLGLMKYFFVIEVKESTQGIFICHKKYDIYILKRFNMDK